MTVELNTMALHFTHAILTITSCSGLLRVQFKNAGASVYMATNRTAMPSWWHLPPSRKYTASPFLHVVALTPALTPSLASHPVAIFMVGSVNSTIRLRSLLQACSSLDEESVILSRGTLPFILTLSLPEPDPRILGFASYSCEYIASWLDPSRQIPV